MKLQFKLMSLALIVFASNVQAVNFAQIKAKVNKENAAELKNKAFAYFNRANAKKTGMVAVPVAAVAGLYKLNKAGKLESAKAKAKQTANNVSSWIKNHKKTTAGLAAGAVATGVAAYNRNLLKDFILGSIQLARLNFFIYTGK